ncbi:MAG: hypothetical protein AAF725_11945 [Acidobacteriota bacterium]
MTRSKLFRPSSPASLALLCGVAFWILASWTPSSEAAASQRPVPTLELWDGASAISSLTVGDDLWVSVSGASTRSPFRVVLLASSGSQIAETEVFAGAHRDPRPSLLWFRSGIKGCDRLDILDPASYRFRDHAEAESWLDQETLRVVLYDPSGQRLSQRILPTRVGGKTRYFFSDASACPRSVFRTHQDVYLSGYRVEPSGEDTTLFLVDQEFPLSFGRVINEVRAAYQVYPQTLSSQLAGDSWTELMWPSGSTTRGKFGAFVRVGGDPKSFDLNVKDVSVGSYIPLEDDRNPHGITIMDWGCPPEELC